jgi:integrase
VATLLDQAGVPIATIADQLGHTDPAMTARVYLGRDLMGDKASVAALL